MLLSCGAGWNPAAGWQPGWQPAWSAGCQPARSLPSCPTKEHILTVEDLGELRIADSLLVPQGLDRVQTRGAAGRPNPEEEADADGNRHARRRRPKRNRGE